MKASVFILVCATMLIASRAHAQVPGTPTSFTFSGIDNINNAGNPLVAHTVVEGFVVVLEQGDSHDPSNWSDVIRFRNRPAQNANAFADFASDLEPSNGIEPGPEPVGFPANFTFNVLGTDPAGGTPVTNATFINEGSDGSSSGEPFFNYVAGNRTYRIFSDPGEVPEPGTLALLATSGISVAGYMIRKRRRQ